MHGNANVFLIYDHGSESQARSLMSGLSSLRFNVLGMEQTTETTSGITAGMHFQDWLARQLNGANVALVVVGEHTFRSQWVETEILESASKGLPIVAVKTKRTNVPPKSLYGVQALWAPLFSAKAISETLRRALDVTES